MARQRIRPKGSPRIKLEIPLTAEEHARIKAAAAPGQMATWARDLLLSAAPPAAQKRGKAT